MSEKNSQIEFPIRINRYLFLNGYCSRRMADKLIEKGHVYINGKPALIGQKVNEKDLVEISEELEKMPDNYIYYILNKPKGVVSHSPQHHEKSVTDFIKIPQPVDVVGRLDKESHGLVFLTNDGRIIDKMLNPKYDHQKEYEVKVDKPLKPSFKNKMEKGVKIEGYMTKPTRVKVSDSNDKSFKIIITEGKKHQIRRMCAALGYQVRDLKRTRIMNLKLGNLKPGESQKLSGKIIKELLGSIGY